MAESVFKENLFDGKKVFITGGATGMGLGFAQAFLNHGAEVFVASRKKDKLEEAAKLTKEKFGKELLWKTMDVRNNETVEEVVENVEVPHSSMANNNEASSTEESLTDKFKRAFSTESISITY